MDIGKSFFRGSIVMLFFFGIFNILNFLFQIIIARSLTLSEYSVVATLLAIVYALSVFSEAIQLVVAKYASSEKNLRKLKCLLKNSMREGLKVSSLFFILYLIVTIPLSKLLGIGPLLFSINGFVIFLVFLLPVARGIMQGRKEFAKLGGSMAVESLGKVIFTVLLIFFGYGVYGVVIGNLIAMTLALVVAVMVLRDIFREKEENMETPRIRDYSKETFFVVLAVTLAYSMDIIIARAVFSPEISGAYAIASILAKAIFWGTSPISKTLFPYASSRNGNRREIRKTLFSSFIIMGGIILIALLIFYFFPREIIGLFAGESNNLSVSVLFLLGIGISIIAITNNFLVFKLSEGGVKRSYLLFIAILIEAALLFIFSDTAVCFALAFVASAIIFFLFSIIILFEKRILKDIKRFK